MGDIIASGFDNTAYTAPAGNNEAVQSESVAGSNVQQNNNDADKPIFRLPDSAADHINADGEITYEEFYQLMQKAESEQASRESVSSQTGQVEAGQETSAYATNYESFEFSDGSSEIHYTDPDGNSISIRRFYNEEGVYMESTVLVTPEGIHQNIGFHQIPEPKGNA